MKESSQKGPQVIAVASGKGGVGKTMISAHLSVSLAELGKKVILIDADFGGANLHSLFGIRPSAPSLTDFFQKRCTFQDVVLNTQHQGLWFIGGHNARFDMANIQHALKLKFLRQLEKLPVDYIILDVGAGTSFHVVDFFLAASKKLVVTTPSQTSIENMYHLLRAAVIRKIKEVLKEHKAEHYLKDGAEEAIVLRRISPKRFVECVYSKDRDLGQALARHLTKLDVNLVVNKTQAASDVELGQAIASSFYDHFGWKLKQLGCVSKDTSVEALERRGTLSAVLSATKTPFLADVQSIASNLAS